MSDSRTTQMTLKEQVVQLKDGRRLGYAEFGEPEGLPLFYFHGTPGSRLNWLLHNADEAARKNNLRIIATDIPGCGLSDFQPNRKLSDWPDDVVNLAEKLKLEKFGVIGYSGGGAYTLACALKIPERLSFAGTVSGVAPANAPGATQGLSDSTLKYRDTVQKGEGASKFFHFMMKMSLRFARKTVLKQMQGSLPPADWEFLSQETDPMIFIKTALESMRQGVKGVSHDARLVMATWDFDPARISIPVYLWQGKLDTNVTMNMARYLEQTIPEAKMTYYETEGHISAFGRHAGEIMETARRVMG